MYRDADKSLARPGRKEAYVSVRTERISFGALPCRKKNLMPARVSMLLKSRASVICFRACFLPGRAKDLSALRYCLANYILSGFSRICDLIVNQYRQAVHVTEEALLEK